MKILKALEIKHLQSSFLSAVTVLSLFAAGCTKERPYKAVFVDEDTHTAKSLLTEAGKGQKKEGQVYPDDVYLYFPSTVNVSRTTTASRPHWAGDAKLVKIKFTKDALKVVEIEKDPRFQDNDLNNAAVLSIPVKHVAFKCVQDADGKCTNQEAENNDISWAQKDHFQVLVNDMKVEEVNFFPEQLSNLFFPCNNVIGQEFAHYDVSPDGLNIQMEKTYQANIMCAGNVESLSDLTFKVRYHFSLIKLNSLVKSGYKALPYLPGEENTFGFFDTRVKTLDSDNNQTVTGEKGFVNRWRPGSKVVYHLSENFNKAGNAKIKKATIDAVATINNSLAKAGAGLVLEIAEPSTKYVEGDLRLNSIILEEDPLATGLLGYGPSITDPMTGEIVNARTVMYIGTMKKYLKNSYDELVHEKLNALAAEAGKKGTGEGIASASATPAKLKFSEGLIQSFIQKAGADAVSVPGHVGKKPSFKMLAAEYSKAAQLLKVSGAHRHGSDKYGKHSHGLREVTRAQSDLKGQLDAFLTANCMYDAELFNFTGAIEDEVEKVIAEVGLKPWIALNAEEQEKVINALMPFVWIPTFVHELGHNLGLRHNFGASEDKANFYTDEERKEMGIRRKFAYSSVMDYPYKSTNELQIMGKYDIAALQFGYAEKVELKDGNVISLEQYRAEKPELKPYDFCTDEHVGINPNCNRFDEGTSLTEIALHHAQAYEESYAKRNFRNNKLNFSLYQDSSYMGSVGSHFDSIRATFERYEKIKRAYGIPDGHEIWKTNEFLKDLRGAVEVSAAFLKKVITTSDLLCAVVKKSDPTTISGLKSLKSMSPNGAATCFDTANVFPDEDEVIVAQGGKLFQSAKDPRNGNPYLDQIDVRGIWIDKLLAVDTLVARKTGIRSFDELSDNMLDIADLSGPIRETLESVLNDEVVSDITLVTSNGQVIEGQIPVQFYNAADAQNGHLIEEPLSEGLAKHLGIKGAVPFNEYLISALKTHLPSKSTMNDPSSLLNSMKVLTTVPTDGRPIGDFETVTIGGDGFLAHKTSTLAVAMISKFKATSTLESAIAGVTAKTPEERVQIIVGSIQKVIELKKAGKTLEEGASEFEKQIFAVEGELIEMFLNGALQDSGFYAQSVRKMAGQ